MLASSLVMGIPFAFASLLKATQARPSPTRSISSTGDAGSRLSQAVPIACWTMILGSAIWALLLTQSRGPILGLCVGSFLAAAVWILISIQSRRTRSSLALMLLGLALFGLLLLLGLNRSPDRFGRLLDIPILARFSTAFDPTRNTTRVRLRLWEASAEAYVAAPERWLLGHGPESLPGFWAGHYPPILAYDEPRGAIPDRAHQMILDTLLTRGLSGLVLEIAFWIGLIVVCIRWHRFSNNTIPEKSRTLLRRGEDWSSRTYPVRPTSYRSQH